MGLSTDQRKAQAREMCMREFGIDPEALRKDAERYRWLRDKAYTAVAVQLIQHMPGEMDGAIDHAMQMDGQDAALRAGRAVGAA